MAVPESVAGQVEICASCRQRVTVPPPVEKPAKRRRRRSGGGFDFIAVVLFVFAIILIAILVLAIRDTPALIVGVWGILAAILFVGGVVAGGFGSLLARLAQIAERLDDRDL